MFRDSENNRELMLLVQLLHFSAIVTGCLSLLILPAVLKVRREPPPASLIALAAIVAVLPIVAALI